MSDKTIAVFADTAEAYEELCSGARALGGRPVALWAGDEADAQRIAAWGARVMHVGVIPEGALYEDCVPAFQEVVQADVDPGAHVEAHAVRGGPPCRASGRAGGHRRVAREA